MSQPTNNFNLNIKSNTNDCIIEDIVCHQPTKLCTKSNSFISRIINFLILVPKEKIHMHDQHLKILPHFYFSCITMCCSLLEIEYFLRLDTTIFTNPFLMCTTEKTPRSSKCVEALQFHAYIVHTWAHLFIHKLVVRLLHAWATLCWDEWIKMPSFGKSAYYFKLSILSSYQA